MSGATTAEIAAVLGHHPLQMVTRSPFGPALSGAVVERMTRTSEWADWLSTVHADGDYGDPNAGRAYRLVQDYEFPT
jgi:hypothetical protein